MCSAADLMGELGKLNVRNDGPGAVATYASFLCSRVNMIHITQSRP